MLGLDLGKLLGKRFVPEGYTAIQQHLPQDVFIVAYPKSGVTWFQNLVCGLVYGVNPELCPPWLVDDLVPDVHFFRFYRRYATPMFFKSHHLPQPDYRRVVYLTRDGRDVMVSFRHYQEALGRKTLDFLKFVTEEQNFPGKWHQHVEAWARNPHGAEILNLKYEDMLKEPCKALERFCEFMGLRRSPGQICAVVEAAQFNHLHEKEIKFQENRAVQWPAGKFFFRRGIAGSHKDEMPPEVLQAFMSDASGTLRGNGYPVDEFI